MKLLSILVLSTALVGCASTPGTPGATTGQSPATIVFNAKTAYAAALVIGNQYKSLPVCTVPATALCHDPAVLSQAQKADNVAFVALNTAESAVRTPQIGATAIDRALSAASAALTAFTSITSQLKVK